MNNLSKRYLLMPIIAIALLLPLQVYGVTRSKTFAHRFYKDYYNSVADSLKHYFRYRIKNTSPIVCNEVIDFINSNHKKISNDYDTIWVIGVQNEIPYSSIIIYRGELLEAYIQHTAYYSKTEIGYAKDEFVLSYLSALQDWNQDFFTEENLISQYKDITYEVWFHITRFIYYKERLISYDEICHHVPMGIYVEYHYLYDK